MSFFEMKLYGIYETYFETIEELESYCQKNGYSMDYTCTLGYLRSVGGRNDVIMKTDRAGRIMLFTAVDEDGYGIYNHKRSIDEREYIWEFCYGDIRELYTPFRDRGIIFENDIYDKIDERNKQFLKMCREKNLFGMGKNDSIDRK